MVFSSVGVQLASMSEVISDTHICYHCGTSTRRVIRHANGLLPCGLVYGAMMAALGQGTTLGSMVLMAGFGLGTIPSLFVLSLLGHRISQGVRKTWSRWLPWWLLVMSVIFILRGMNLGIPVISPKVQTATHHGSCCRPN